MFNNIQPLCVPNGVPYSPSVSHHPTTSTNYNPLLGMPYQQYPQISPMNNFTQNIPTNTFKVAPAMNEFDKTQFKNIQNFTKSPPINYPMVPPGQFSAQELLDRNFIPVQFNATSHFSKADMFMNRTAATTTIHPTNPIPISYSNINNKRLQNDVLINNPTLVQQAQTSMYLSNQAKFMCPNPPKSNMANNKKYSNNNSCHNNRNNRRGLNHSNSNNRKY